MGEFPSGQRGQTVNLLSLTSVVRIHLPPPEKGLSKESPFSMKFASGEWVDSISYFALVKYFTKGVAFDFTASVSERFL